VIRIAAAGDLHFGTDSAGTLRPALDGIGKAADVLLLAGDLTRLGKPEEAAILADELAGLDVPILAVLGNHDFESDRESDVVSGMEEAGVKVLEGDGEIIDVGGCRVGVAGVKGFGGGFAGASGSDFGEPEMKAFVRHTKQVASALEDTLGSLARRGAQVRIALLHYSPVRDTLMGEPPEIFPFLGSYLLAEAVDRAGADLALHGHAHRGTEKGVTPGGVHVRNVAQPVIQRAYNIYLLRGDGEQVGPVGPRAQDREGIPRLAH
jgi:Icc-related predicted phosphoesterase